MRLFPYLYHKKREAQLRLRWLFAFFAFTIQMFQSLEALAQTKIQTEMSLSSKQELTALIETDVRKIIERQIPPEAFQIILKTKSKTLPTIENPYLPDSLTESNPSIFGSWKSQVDDVQIEIRLAPRYGEKTRRDLQEIIAGKLDLDKQAISFKTLEIEVPPSRSDIEMSLQKAEADSRNSKNQADQLARERDDAKRELDLAKQAAKEKESQKKPDSATDKGQSADSATAALISKYAPYILMGAGGLILLFILTSWILLRSTANTLGSAIRTIGESIPVLGDRVVQAAGIRPEGEDEDDNPAILPQGGDDFQKALPASQLAGLPLESIHARILSLHQELKEASKDNQFVVVRFLTHLLKDPGLIGKAVVSMEILGKDVANSLYIRLSSDDQEKISKFLESGQHNRSKWELMLEAGEELKTKILAAGMSGLRGSINEKIAEKVLKLRTEDLANIANKISIEAIPRMFLYLEPAQLADVLMHVRNKNMEQFIRFSGVLVKIADAINEGQMDTVIAETMDAHLANIKGDHQRPFLSYYKSLLESVDESAADIIVEVLTTGGPTIESFIQENIITFSTFFKLQTQLQENILDALSNRDLAALLVNLIPQQDPQIRSKISDKRMELIDEELERLKDKAPRQVEQAHEAVKRQIVKRITALRGTGTIGDLLDKNREQVTNSNPSTTENAA